MLHAAGKELRDLVKLYPPVGVSLTGIVLSLAELAEKKISKRNILLSFLLFILLAKTFAKLVPAFMCFLVFIVFACREPEKNALFCVFMM